MITYIMVTSIIGERDKCVMCQFLSVDQVSTPSVDVSTTYVRLRKKIILVIKISVGRVCCRASPIKGPISSPKHFLTKILCQPAAPNAKPTTSTHVLICLILTTECLPAVKNNTFILFTLLTNQRIKVEKKQVFFACPSFHL